MTTDTLELPPLPGRLTTLSQADIDAIRAYATAAVLAERETQPALSVLHRLASAAKEAMPQLCDTSIRGLREADELRAAVLEAERALVASAIRNKE